MTYGGTAKILKSVFVTPLQKCLPQKYSHKLIQDDLPDVASKYNALIASMNHSEDENQLKLWLSLASTQDLEHISRFLAFISENFPEKNDLPPLTCLTQPIWQEAMMPKQNQSLKRTDWLSGVVTPTYKVPRLVYDKMAFIATEWTSPLSLDSSLIPMLLHLLPMDFCSPSSAAPARFSMSARPTASRASTEENGRIFSPRVDVITMYAERGRKMMAKQEMSRGKFSDERKIRSICSRLKQKVNTQRSLEEDINEERSFVESLSSSKSTNFADLGVAKKKPSQLSQEGGKQLKYSAKAFNRDLEMLDKKLDEIQHKLKYKSPENSTVSDSQRTEEVPDEGSEVGEDRVTEELAPLPLNYEETGPAPNPVPELERLDFSLLSPGVDTGRRKAAEKFPGKSEKGVLTQPEWMKLIPLGETNSSRFPLLQYNIPTQKESKTERSTQTVNPISVSSREIADKGCQTKEDERIPPDSGFLDTLERTPRKKVEMIQPMSKKNIEEMLSQM
ncbi:hypothetical protein OESDEN_05914 [Oesophagostomum dentatum]|uniref:Uncharacterized protein n=1 Tax=Oesophagostomum dentatum TaxID=61180 RepID=A0A0B1TFM4_OESDE|nr:hypothetical protein OESDEN_05914 [Oesophagostomum dentatum]